MQMHVRVNYGLCRFVNASEKQKGCENRGEKHDLTSTKSQGALIGLNLQLILTKHVPKFYLSSVLETTTFPL